jgi:hypothetical protein
MHVCHSVYAMRRHVATESLRARRTPGYQSPGGGGFVALGGCEGAFRCHREALNSRAVRGEGVKLL